MFQEQSIPLASPPCSTDKFRAISCNSNKYYNNSDTRALIDSLNRIISEGEGDIGGTQH